MKKTSQFVLLKFWIQGDSILNNQATLSCEYFIDKTFSFFFYSTFVIAILIINQAIFALNNRANLYGKWAKCVI